MSDNWVAGKPPKLSQQLTHCLTNSVQFFLGELHDVVECFRHFVLQNYTILPKFCASHECISEVVFLIMKPRYKLYLREA